MPVVDRTSLLKLDADLGSALPAELRTLAAERLIVRLERLPAGDWHPQPDEFGARHGIGLLIGDGFIVRHVKLEHRAGAEVLGPGDLLRPWQDDGEYAVYPYVPGWRAVTAVTFAVLDLAFASRLGPFPEVTAAITGRAMSRSRRVAGHLVLAQLASVEHRVLLVLWQLADLWGRVRPDGVLLPVPLTHRLLGLTIGARRPSVTTALGALAEQDLVRSLGREGFLLLGPPPQDLPLLRGAATSSLPSRALLSAPPA
jgi:CRP-like cAMP-binding protein